MLLDRIDIDLMVRFNALSWGCSLNPSVNARRAANRSCPVCGTRWSIVNTRWAC